MLNIALFYGGTSSERAVSLKTGERVAVALQEIGHKVQAHDLQENSLENLSLEDVDFAFIALHGGWGENGGIQKALEQKDIPYSGSGPIASSQAIDKERMKAQFLAQRIPTPGYEILREADACYRLKRMARRLSTPLIIKPTCQGSSLGISLINSLEEASDALKKAFTLDERVIAEKKIEGREFAIPVIHDNAYPPVEIIHKHSFFDYEAKYHDTSTYYEPSPEISSIQLKIMQYYARRAHDALRCHGYSRVDMILDDQGDVYVLEVNTLPGLTERSLLPLSTNKAGMSYEETLQAMIDASLSSSHQQATQIKNTSSLILS